MGIIKLRFDGQVFIPQGAVDLAPGTEVDLDTSRVSKEPKQKHGLAKLAEIAEQFPSDPNYPADFAIEHDHYLYGTPKKNA